MLELGLPATMFKEGGLCKGAYVWAASMSHVLNRFVYNMQGIYSRNT